MRVLRRLEQNMLSMTMLTMLKRMLRGIPLLVCSLAAVTAACGSGNVLPGTSVVDTPVNREIVETVEKYRERLVARNVEGLIVLAAQDYHEDGGTPSAPMGQRRGHPANISQGDGFLLFGHMATILGPYG